MGTASQLQEQAQAQALADQKEMMASIGVGAAISDIQDEEAEQKAAAQAEETYDPRRKKGGEHELDVSEPDVSKIELQEFDLDRASLIYPGRMGLVPPLIKSDVPERGREGGQRSSDVPPMSYYRSLYTPYGLPMGEEEMAEPSYLDYASTLMPVLDRQSSLRYPPG